MQCVRPRAIVAPLQIGLAVQMHFHFRSRYLIDVLHSFGICSSYNEVQRFERNAAVCGDDAINAAIKGESTLIIVADNVDHNICTLGRIPSMEWAWLLQFPMDVFLVNYCLAEMSPMMTF